MDKTIKEINLSELIQAEMTEFLKGKRLNLEKGSKPLSKLKKQLIAEYFSDSTVTVRDVENHIQRFLCDKGVNFDVIVRYDNRKLTTTLLEKTKGEKRTVDLKIDFS